MLYLMQEVKCLLFLRLSKFEELNTTTNWLFQLLGERYILFIFIPPDFIYYFLIWGLMVDVPLPLFSVHDTVQESWTCPHLGHPVLPEWRRACECLHTRTQTHTCMHRHTARNANICINYKRENWKYLLPKGAKVYWYGFFFGYIISSDIMRLQIVAFKCFYYNYHELHAILLLHYFSSFTLHQAAHTQLKNR